MQFDPYGGSEMAVVAIFSSEVEAAVAKAALESAGIQCIVSSDDCGGMERFLTTKGIKLMVRARDQEQAREFLATGGTQTE